MSRMPCPPLHRRAPAPASWPGSLSVGWKGQAVLWIPLACLRGVSQSRLRIGAAEKPWSRAQKPPINLVCLLCDLGLVTVPLKY